MKRPYKRRRPWTRRNKITEPLEYETVTETIQTKNGLRTITIKRAKVTAQDSET